MQHMLSIIYFLCAGLCEIGGGYLVWRWLREGKSLWYGVLGAIILILYGDPHHSPPFRTRLCRLWWCVHHAVDSVGMAD
jgi:hypothetical protein